jgi:hypothetical protein
MIVRASAAKSVRGYAREQILTSGGKFADVSLTLTVNAPNWVESVFVNDDSDIVVKTKQIGMAIIIR